MALSWVLVASVLAIAFANGANDNFKGVATLFGSRTTDFRRALAWATVTTASGSMTALVLAGALVARFSGKGLVPETLTSDPAFLTAVGGGAAATVLLATAIGAPISTTHALVGALIGAGALASAGRLQLAPLAGIFIAPLLLSPLLAVGLVGIVHPALSVARRRWEAGTGTCICATELRTAVPGTGAGVIREGCVPLTFVASPSKCEAHGLSPGVTLPRSLDLAHYLSAGAVGFARGVNDTPKLVALLVPFQAGGVQWGLPVVAATIALGGVLASRRVAETMSHRITTMTPAQGFAANLVTACLVFVASRLGLPVSTTHVSAGSLFGLGAVTRGARWKVIGQIILAWVATIPLAAAFGAILWLALTKGLAFVISR